MQQNISKNINNAESLNNNDHIFTPNTKYFEKKKNILKNPNRIYVYTVHVVLFTPIWNTKYFPLKNQNRKFWDYVNILLPRFIRKIQKNVHIFPWESLTDNE